LIAPARGALLASLAAGCAPLEGDDGPWGIAALDEEAGEYAWAGYRMTTFRVGDEYGLPTADGEPPRFRLIWPEEPGDAPRPVLLFLHGGALDDDGATPGGELAICGTYNAAASVTDRLRNSALAHLAAEAGWIVVAPENAFCDGWVGLGAPDPVDPCHGGYALARLALEWTLYGQEGAAIDEGRVMLAGSSQGAMGAALFAARWPGQLAAAAMAHGATDAVRLYYEDDYNGTALADRQRRLEHALGGPPLTAEGGDASAFYGGYRDLSLVRAVADGAITAPLLHTWSRADPISWAVAHEGAAEVIEAAYEPAGGRWLDYESGVAAHDAVHDLDLPFSALVAARFLAGGEVAVLEGEDHLAEVGRALTNPKRWGDRSGQSVSLADTPGRLFAAEVAPAASARATFLLFMDEAGEAIIRLRAGGEVAAEARLRAADLAREENHYPSLREALAASTLEVDAAGSLRVEVEVLAGEVGVDAVIVDLL